MAFAATSGDGDGQTRLLLLICVQLLRLRLLLLLMLVQLMAGESSGRAIGHGLRGECDHLGATIARRSVCFVIVTGSKRKREKIINANTYLPLCFIYELCEFYLFVS